MRKWVWIVLICLTISPCFSAAIEQKDISDYLDSRKLVPIKKGGFLFKITHKDGGYFYLYGSDHNLFVNKGEFPVKRTALSALEDSSYFVSESGMFGSGLISGFFAKSAVDEIAKNKTEYTNTFSDKERFTFLQSIAFSRDDIARRIKKHVADGSNKDDEEIIVNDALKVGESYVPVYWIWNSFDMRCPRKSSGNVKDGVSVEGAIGNFLSYKGLAFEELQNPAEHLKNIFQTMPIDDQVSALKEFMVFRMQPSGKCGSHWLNEDWAGISALQDEYMNTPYVALRNFYKVWISDRNKIFFNNISIRTKQPGVGFFVVGTAHLLFNDGLIQLFKNDGYQVELMP